jgi:hypothetical protein
MRIHIRKLVWSWSLLGILCMGPTIGCGKAPIPKGAVKKAEVSGTITLAGKPIEGAEVYFFTEKFTGFGKTDAQGKFRLAQGAAVGPNKVYISKLEGGGAAATGSDPIMALNDPGQMQAASQSSATPIEGPKELIPNEYSNQQTSKLTFDVPDAGAKEANFNL